MSISVGKGAVTTQLFPRCEPTVVLAAAHSRLATSGSHMRLRLRRAMAVPSTSTCGW